jgi:maleylpyruvate isomerase
MSRPDTAIEGVRAAHAQLALHLDMVDDATARRPSLLPDWSIGHVLTHIARNAEGQARMLEGAARGEVAEMYPGGISARNTAITDGSSRSAAELRLDVLESAARFETAAAALTAEQWTNGIGRRIQGDQAIAEVPRLRRREVLLHHVDLGLDGFTFADLPEDYVALDLPEVLATVPGRLEPSDRRALFGWVTGRIAGLEPLDLAPW